MEIIDFDEEDFRTYYSKYLQMNRNSAYYTFSDIDYMKEYEIQYNFTNHSFIAVNNKVPIFGILFTSHDLDGKKIISAFGRPMLFFVFEGVKKNILNPSFKKVIKNKFSEFLDTENYKIIYCDNLDINGNLNIFTRYLLEKNFAFRSSYLIKIDLRKNLEILKSEVRKSYRKNLVWSAKNLKIRVFDSKNCNEKIFKEFQDLHYLAAGRKTRNKNSWKIQYNQIKNNEAVLVGGTMQGSFVTFLFVTYNSHYAVYSVAASDRDLFDKPLSHGLMWEVIKYLKGKGCKTLEIGEKLYSGKDKKLLGIDKFKSGFGGEIYTRLELSHNKKIK